MNRILTFVAIVTALAASTAPLFASVMTSQVSVSLTALSGARNLRVTCSGQFSVLEPVDGSVVVRVDPGSAAEIAVFGEEITVTVDHAAYHVPSLCTLKPSSSDAFLAISAAGGKPATYRGVITVNAVKGRLNARNVVEVEDYLRGVVPLEMPVSYPEEALKAQAVAARTYVYLASQRLPKSGKELCDTSHCQKYAGVSVEKPKCDKAIADTAGMVLTYAGALATTMYCADSGGTTANYCDYYPGAVFPYLTSCPDPAETRHIEWRTTIPAVAAISGIGKDGCATLSLPLTHVSVTKADAAGRALEVEFATAKSKTAVAAQKLRALFGPDVIKSTVFTVKLTDDGKVEFAGKGYGHGFGMSQRGAGAMAAHPNNKTWREILAHYYPGTQVVSAATLQFDELKPSSAPARADKRSSAAAPVR